MKKILIITLILSMLLCGTQALASVMVITGTPTYDDSEGMTQNLNRATETLNGAKIEKGKTFSFNDIVGPRTEANGFTAALNGNGVSIMGGGVAQVATTLYQALKELGDDVTYDERHTFGSAFNAGYAEDGKDTALTDYSRGLDFKFTNQSSDDLVISMWNGGGTLFCQLTDASIVTETPTEAPTEAPAETPAETPAEEPAEEPAATEAPTPAPASGDTYYVVNVKSHVNLREEPSTDSTILAGVSKGSAVQSTGETTDDFMRVEYDGKTGYIHSKYLAKGAPTEIWLTIVNCSTGVSLRESASKKADKLADVALGERVRSFDHEENGFLEVEYNGTRGFILKDYLEENQE